MIGSTTAQGTQETAPAPLVGAPLDPRDVLSVTLPVQRRKRPSVTAVVRVVDPTAGAADPRAALTTAADLVDAGEVLVVNLTRHPTVDPDLVDLVLECARSLDSRSAVLAVAAPADTTIASDEHGVLVATSVAEAAEAAMTLLQQRARRTTALGARTR